MGKEQSGSVQILRQNLIEIVSELHAALQEIGHDQMPQTNVVNNARDRLHYIATLTEQSASQTLHAAESLSDSLHAQQNQARALLQKAQSAEVSEFFQALNSQHAASLVHVSDIIQAQVFQDLVGQVIGKLMVTIEKMETSLAHLLIDEEAGDADSNLLAGPQVRPQEQVSQADIDNLFD
jgi:chemotaxis protein CheZ